jgi:hypothetical protein
MTYSDQVPFGFVPLKTERAEPTIGGPGVGPPGAGGAKKSTPPHSQKGSSPAGKFQ